METSFSDHDKSLHISDSRIPVGALQARKEDIFLLVGCSHYPNLMEDYCLSYFVVVVAGIKHPD